MDFTPLGDRVLLKVQEVETQTASGIYIPDNASKEKPTQAQVVAIGNDVKLVNVGDKVVYTKFARSASVTLDGNEYLVMETAEILGVMK
ncbi:MAG: co-chaperone GroES [Campylobacteraceae bacterium]|jgi:chaperonin GroES|nr:co-chaperone GroES [Campylobacteraceae bacterium]MBT3882993.1 co-chaperone GroES [Campylobacteraceae bacterium]MBT4030543.1 co-chaperone GroES [Campylobacteraceae bacterium]MBT4179554.1 co-chaperone GroES [Campylobacteraceae bacterium]MBT4572213.1 co-chaperone GroES [Campylobacteraceae bacterium]